MSTIKSSAENLTLNADGANNDIKFQSNGSEVASIDQAGLLTAASLNTTGSVGIGIAPKTTSSSFDSLQIGGGGSISAYYNGVNGAGTDFGNNFYVNSGGSERYIFTEEAAKAKFEQGTVELYVAASGSEDAAITWTKGFEVLNDGKARAKNGLLFGTDTAAANALDDYEEGTWTAGFAFGGNAVSMTYDANSGWYTKTGNVVVASCNLDLSNKGSSTGNASITGLPFTSDGHYGCAWGYNLYITHSGSFIGRNENSATINLNQVNDSGVSGPLTNSNFQNNSRCVVTLTYRV